jgi:large conductance mechanosensitive channel
MNKTLKEFRDFMAGGNLIDLAVNAVAKGIVEPFIAMFFGKPNFDDVLSFTINDSTFRPGLVLSALFTLVATGAVVYFGIVVPYTRIRRPRDPAGPTQEELLTQIRDLLARR